MDRFIELDVLGAIEGSDKSSSHLLGWDYLRHYEAVLAQYRGQAVNVLEIGIFQGASLRSWQAFFPQAQIVGVDIEESCRRYAGERMTVEIGSQADGAFLDDVCRRAPPTVVIDDGSHIPEHMVFTFEAVFPHLLPGGTYVIEDIVHHGRPSSPGGANPSQYALDLALWCFSNRRIQPRVPVPEAILRSVDRVSFIRSAAIFHKQDETRDVPAAMAIAEKRLSGPGEAARHAYYAEWLYRHGGPPSAIGAAVDRAEAGGYRHPVTKLLRAHALLRAGNPAGARAVSAGLTPETVRQPPMLIILAELHAGLGDMETARAVHAAAQGFGMSHQVRREWSERLPEIAGGGQTRRLDVM